MLVRAFDGPSHETGRSIRPERPLGRRTYARAGVDITAFSARYTARQQALAEEAGKDVEQAFYRDTLHTHFSHASSAKIRIPAA
jgi:hypothetical protein